MIQYLATAFVLTAFAIVLAACGVRSAPTYNYATNGETQYSYPPKY